jgi:hypothetical protein
MRAGCPQRERNGTLPSSNRTPEPPEKASLAHTAANDRSLDSATFLGLVAGGVPLRADARA